MKKTLYILAFLFIQISAFSQAADSLNCDYSSPVIMKKSEKIIDYLNDDYYNYDFEPAETTESIWETFWRRVIKFFRYIESGGKPVSYSFYAIMIIVLIFAVTKLMGLNYQTLIMKSSKIKSSNFDVFEEDIYGINFEQEISKAEKIQNYGTAIRYLYIKFLKILTDNELIEWQINKTNKDYRREMKKTKYFSAFKHLTIVYEYVWYGEFKITSQKYEKLKSEFNKTFKVL